MGDCETVGEFLVDLVEPDIVASFPATAPTAEWVVQQSREAFPFDTAPRYSLRDRNVIYGEEVRQAP